MSESKRAATMDKIVALCKRRGFIYPGSEIYGGLANTWDDGPLGVELKNNVSSSRGARSCSVGVTWSGLDAGILMHPRVWKSATRSTSTTRLSIAKPASRAFERII